MAPRILEYRFVYCDSELKNVRKILDITRFRLGLAVDCGSVVCAADGVETNKIMIMQKAGLQSHFLLEITALPICADIFYENVLSFYIRLRKDAGGKAFCFV